MNEIDRWWSEISCHLCEGFDNQMMAYERERLLVELFRQLSPEFQDIAIEYLRQLLNQLKSAPLPDSLRGKNPKLHQ